MAAPWSGGVNVGRAVTKPSYSRAARRSAR